MEAARVVGAMEASRLGPPSGLPPEKKGKGRRCLFVCGSTKQEPSTHDLAGKAFHEQRNQ